MSYAQLHTECLQTITECGKQLCLHDHTIKEHTYKISTSHMMWKLGLERLIDIEKSSDYQ